MKMVLRKKNEQSDRFWRIETAGCEYVTNWGKMNVTGCCILRRFPSEAACEAHAAKRISMLRQNGYVDMAGFDEMNRLYFDASGEEPHPLTSHPLFRKYFFDQFYYSCKDRDAPFGCYEGRRAYARLPHLLHSNPNVSFAQSLEGIFKELELEYYPPALQQSDEELCEMLRKMFYYWPTGRTSLSTDQVILAVALGQIKITGKLDVELQDLAFRSLMRIEQFNRIVNKRDNYGGYVEYGDDVQREMPHYVSTIRWDLIQFINRT